MYCSRFRETYFFSAGKKSKHADQQETMSIKKIKTSKYQPRGRV